MPNTVDVRMRTRPVRLGVREPLTVERAIDRLAEAAQSVISDQIEVARVDVKVVGRRILQSAPLLIAGTLLLIGAWTALALAVYVLLVAQLPPGQVLGLIALAHGVLGLGLLLAGARGMKDHAND